MVRDENEYPSEIRVGITRTSLAVHWRDGLESRLGAAALRTACRCSSCVAAAAQGAVAEPADGSLAIVSVASVGNYGVNIEFSDGHARGIFPWAYLRELAVS